VQTLVTIVLAVILGIIYLQLDDSYPAGLQNRWSSNFILLNYHCYRTT